MHHNDPLKNMRWPTNPLGCTSPGSYPMARLGGGGPIVSLIAQHHEALHHDFNTCTTLGNSLQLLGQLATKCPPPLKDIAFKVALHWNDAQIHELEGLINYVCYKRVARLTNLSKETYETFLDKVHKLVWHEWVTRYDTLDISENSKDALAMHIGKFALNIPVYNILDNLDFLDSALSFITRDNIRQRFKQIENVLFSRQRHALLHSWDIAMKHLWMSDSSEADKQKKEAYEIDNLLRYLLPKFESVPRQRVADSIRLASNWNAQLDLRKLPANCHVEIEFIEYMDAAQHVVIQPPAPSIIGLALLNDESFIVKFLKDNPDSYCLCIVHSEKSDLNIISRKYNRVLRKGDIYVRFSFVKPTLNSDRYDILDRHFFTILAADDLQHLLKHLAHPHLVLTQSEPSYEILDRIIECNKILQDQVWRFHWGKPVSWALNNVQSNREEIKWLHSVYMINSQTFFLLVKSGRNNYLDVYPLPSASMGFFMKLDFREKFKTTIESKMLYGILGLVMNIGF